MGKPMRALGKRPPIEYGMTLSVKCADHYRQALLEAADKLEKDDHGNDTVAVVHCARGCCSVVAEVIKELRISAGEHGL
jgi:rhodanese-related sulfurtransferase